MIIVACGMRIKEMVLELNIVFPYENASDPKFLMN